MKTVKIILSHTLTSDPVCGFDQTCIDIFLGGGKGLIRFW